MVPRRLLVGLVSVSAVLAATVAVVISKSPADPVATPSAVDDFANGEPVTSEASARPGPPAPFTFRWPAGTVYTYTLSMESAELAK